MKSKRFTFVSDRSSRLQRVIPILFCLILASNAWGALSGTMSSNTEGGDAATANGLYGIGAMTGSLTWTVDQLTSGEHAGKWLFRYAFVPYTADKNRGIGSIAVQFGSLQPDLVSTFTYDHYNIYYDPPPPVTYPDVSGGLLIFDRTLANPTNPNVYDSWLVPASPSTSRVNVTSTFSALQWVLDTDQPRGSSFTLDIITSIPPMWGNMYFDGYNITTNYGYGMVRNIAYDSPPLPFSMTDPIVSGKIPVPGDTTPPAISVSAPSVAITNDGPVGYTITYSDATFQSSSLSAGDITLNTTGTANASVTVTGSGTTRTVTLSGITGDGTLGISIAAGTAIDALGNLAPASSPSATFVVDNTPPSVAIGFPSPVATRTGPVAYTITYNDAHFDMSTLSASDVTLNTSGTAGTVTVTGSGSLRSVNINSISGSGTMGISIGTGTARDTAGNLAPSAGPAATFIVDTTAPGTTANPSRGTYASAQSVTLTCTDNANGSGCDRIFYTTDGSDPSTASAVYSSAVTIANTTTLKYFAQDFAGNNESVKTQSYTINLSVPHYTLILGTSAYYETLLAAYQAAADGNTILARDMEFTEVLTLDQAKAVTLIGGYDAGYSASTGFTTLKGTLTVTSGAATVDKIIIK